LFTLDSYWNITEVSHILGLLDYMEKLKALILAKMDWATFWAIFSQIHLVGIG
jgi:hypothetical protein